MATTKKAAAKTAAASSTETGAAARSPREVADELAQLEADASASCTPVPPETRTALQLEFMSAVCDALEA